MKPFDIHAVSAWLEPLAGESCGPLMEYEPGFMELEQAAAGKPETQFGPAEPPSWPLVREQAETLLDQTRDLRVALFWARSAVNLEGIEGLVLGLKLLLGLLDNFWDDLHPRPDPDDGDTFARVSVLASLVAVDGLLGDLRQVPILRDRRLGGLRMRDVEVALSRLERRPDDNAYTTSQVQGLIGEHPDLLERIKTATAAAIESLQALRRVMDDRFGISSIELKTLMGMLTGLKSVIPEETLAEPTSEEDESSADAAVDAPRRASPAGGGLAAIQNRQDAVRAINMVCAYLERFEPTNPAQLLLRRAERLIDKNFIQLVRDLAPEAVAEVARILGVSPDDFNDAQEN